jgi:hypothetical protein
MRKFSFSMLFFMLVVLAVPQMAAANTNHADLISKYEGTKTCLTCHEQMVKDVAVSLHYQQQAGVPYVKDWPQGQNGGMMVSY